MRYLHRSTLQFFINVFSNIVEVEYDIKEFSNYKKDFKGLFDINCIITLSDYKFFYDDLKLMHLLPAINIFDNYISVETGEEFIKEGALHIGNFQEETQENRLMLPYKIKPLYKKTKEFPIIWINNFSYFKMRVTKYLNNFKNRTLSNEPEKGLYTIEEQEKEFWKYCLPLIKKYGNKITINKELRHCRLLELILYLQINKNIDVISNYFEKKPKTKTSNFFIQLKLSTKYYEKIKKYGKGKNPADKTHNWPNEIVWDVWSTELEGKRASYKGKVFEFKSGNTNQKDLFDLLIQNQGYVTEKQIKDKFRREVTKKSIDDMLRHIVGKVKAVVPKKEEINFHVQKDRVWIVPQQDKN